MVDIDYYNIFIHVININFVLYFTTEDMHNMNYLKNVYISMTDTKCSSQAQLTVCPVLASNFNNRHFHTFRKLQNVKREHTS